MSILIDKNTCKACGKCMDVCPGSLIKKDDKGRAYIKYPQYCWGCTSCLKECKNHSIKFYLGADIGGCGTKIYIDDSEKILDWFFEKTDGSIEKISILKKESNKY